MEYAEDAPLLKARFALQRSIFVPGARIRMNVVPMFLNVFVPWGAFVFCCGMTSFWVMYVRPDVAWTCVALVYGTGICMAATALWARRNMADPTWFTYAALAVLVMAFAGTQTGLGNFNSLAKPYFDVKQMKVINNLDASYVPSKNVVDGGIFNFAPGNHLDSLRSWHFHWKGDYCVAPIITNQTAPSSRVYDFWAVGKDCCSTSASDFRCGAWGFTGTAGGIRVINEGDLKYYRLAVQQAESLYDISAPDPIFMEWSSSPYLEVESWNQLVFKNYLFMTMLALVCSIFMTTCASCSFAFIGRGRSVYSGEILNDPAWNEGPYGKHSSA